MNHNYNKNLKTYAQELRTASVSRAEKYIWKSLLSRGKMGVKFKRQRPIADFIVDFFSQEIGLIIEIDGSSHFKKGTYDNFRETKLKELGYEIVRFKEGEVINQLDDVYLKLVHVIECLKRDANPSPPRIDLQLSQKKQINFIDSNIKFLAKLKT